MKGIDISKWQPDVDYQKLKEQGIEFVIIRCGYGKDASQKDSCFEKHYQGLKEAGIKVGCYLYSYVTSIENSYKEAENCLNLIKGKTFELPIFYDLEDKKTAPLGKDAITQCALNFCKTIKEAGYQSGVYANLNWFKNYINVKELINSGYTIWLAQWNTNGEVRHTADFKVDYLQYSDDGKIIGIPRSS